MAKPRRVVWVEGMSLAQQHLQHWDHEYRQQLRMVQENFSPYGYGLFEMEIDSVAIQQGLFRVEKLTAIFPNRQWVNFTCQQNKQLSCYLELEVGSTVEVFLCLPMNQQVKGISGYPETQSITAWRGTYECIHDDYDDTREVEVLFAEPELYLLTSKVGLEQFFYLKIAEVTLQESYGLNKNYYPPAIFISSSTELFNQLLSMSAYLEGQTQLLQKTVVKINLTRDINLLLHVLSLTTQASGRMKALTCQRQETPKSFYDIGIDLLSSLAGLSGGQFDFELIEYNHLDLKNTFYEIKSQLDFAYKKIVPSTDKVIPLEKKSQGYYFSKNIAVSDLTEQRIYLSVVSTIVGEEWKNDFSKSIKIAAVDELPKIISSSISGVGLTLVSHLPNSMSLVPGQVFFEMITHGIYWDQILGSGSLGIFVPEFYKDCKIGLVVHKNV